MDAFTETNIGCTASQNPCTLWHKKCRIFGHEVPSMGRFCLFRQSVCSWFWYVLMSRLSFLRLLSFLSICWCQILLDVFSSCCLVVQGQTPGNRREIRQDNVGDKVVKMKFWSFCSNEMPKWCWFGFATFSKLLKQKWQRLKVWMISSTKAFFFPPLLVGFRFTSPMGKHCGGSREATTGLHGGLERRIWTSNKCDLVNSYMENLKSWPIWFDDLMIVLFDMFR